MGFSARQVRLLQRHINPRHLRSREANGRELTYIEGWHAIDEANRIFGFDGWDRETAESRCISAREVHGVFRALYMARVKITVRAEGVAVVREGSGTGDARGTSVAEAHDLALKSAETDATKRALATFGKPFGLALYLKVKPREGKSDGNGQAPIARLGSQAPRTNHPIPAPSDHPNPPGYRRSPPAMPSPKEALAIRSGRDRVNADDLPKQSGPFVSSLAPKERQAGQAPAQKEDKSEAVSPTQPHAPSVSSTSGEIPSENSKTTTAAAGDSDPIRDDARSRIDKSVLTHGAARRYRDKVHLRFVAQQPCLVCSRRPADAHHLRFAQPRSISQKVSDEFTVPLCRLHHRELHQAGKEQEWWEAHSIDPLPVARELWTESRARRFDGKEHDLAPSDPSQARGSQ